MSKAAYSLQLPHFDQEGRTLAQEDGVSLNQWITVAAAEHSEPWKLRLNSSRGGLARPRGMA
jgi:hypothetical protein